MAKHTFLAADNHVSDRRLSGAALGILYQPRVPLRGLKGVLPWGLRATTRPYLKTPCEASSPISTAKAASSASMAATSPLTWLMRAAAS